MVNRITEKIRSLTPDAFLDYYTQVIDKRLEAYCSRIMKEATNYNSFIGEATERMGEFLLRKGKRIVNSRSWNMDTNPIDSNHENCKKQTLF